LKPLTPWQFRRYIERPIYCGVRCEKWTNREPIKAQGRAIISIETFNRANRGKIIITEKTDGSYTLERNVKSYQCHRHNPEFLLRHTVTCPQCHKPLVASKSRNKLGNYYGYYHCSRKHKYFGIKKKEFENTVANFLGLLIAKPGFLPIFREIVCDVWVRKNKATQREVTAIGGHIQELETRQKNALEKIHQGLSPIVQKMFEEEIEQLETSITQAKQNKTDIQLTDDKIEDYFQVAKKLMEHPKKYILEATTKQKLEKIWSFVFAQLPTYDQISNGTPQLSLIYRLSGNSKLTKSQMAEELSRQWNTFCNEVDQAYGIEKLL
jgi:hypothetical protein